jgi:hypothetical protein
MHAAATIHDNIRLRPATAQTDIPAAAPVQ